MNSGILLSLLDIRTLLVATCVFLVTYLYMYRRDKGYKLPKGPFVLPVIGNLYAFSSKLDGYVRASEVFGDAMTLYAGPIRAVLLNSYDYIKEAAITKAADFSDRGLHVSYCSNIVNPSLKGVISSDFHERLRQNRSQTLTILRNLGVGRSTMEENILEEANDLANVFCAKNGEAFDPWHIITCAVANVILHVTFNKRHRHDDPELLEIVTYTDDVIKSGYHVPLIDGLNILRFIPPFSKTYAKFVAGDRGMREYMWKYAKKQIDDFQPGHGSNYVDCWLDSHFNDKESKPLFDRENFECILRDFLIAGTETTTTSLKWTILFLVNRPDIQEKVYHEIDSVVGKERSVRLSDRNNLPYLEAVILENQRFNTILPGCLPHYAKRESKIGKYDIPGDTIIGFNLHAVHMCKETFGDPEKFRPERFIDGNGKFIKHPHVIPFSIGKRSCLGELLARQELFLFTAALFQKFKFVPPEGVTEIDEKGIIGFTYTPVPFRVRALLR